MRTFKKTIVYLAMLFCVYIMNFCYFKFESMKRDSNLNQLIRIMPHNSEGMLSYRNMESNAVVPWTYDERFKNPCWYEKDGLHCLPYYFIIGVKKCGTTALYCYQIKHPESIRLFKKEPQFFSGNGNMPFAMQFEIYHGQFTYCGDSSVWERLTPVVVTEFFPVNKTGDIYAYVRMFSNASKKIEQHSYDDKSTKYVNKYIFCDGSTTYINLNHHWKTMPGNAGLNEPKYVILDYIHKFLPKAKLIMAVRDPVDRLYSDYYFTFKRDEDVINKASPQHFHEVVVKAIQDYRLCLNAHSLRFCVYNKDLFNYNEPLFRFGFSLSDGMYHVFMEELLRLFPREQIHVMKSKEIGSRDSIRRLFGFLEMSRVSDVKLEYMTKTKITINERLNYFKSKGPMLNTTQNILYEFYRPYNERMAALTGDGDFLFKMADLV